MKIEPAPDEWDRTYGVDFFIEVSGSHIGIQIKPVDSGKSINDYQWATMHQNSHERFNADHGGKVFFVYSEKAAGKKKRISNTEVIEEIKDEIERLKHE